MVDRNGSWSRFQDRQTKLNTPSHFSVDTVQSDPLLRGSDPLREVILSHRIALDPTADQVEAFRRASGVARFTWNWALAEWGRQYEAGEKPTALKLKKRWNSIKGVSYPWVYESPKGVNQQVFTNLGKAFKCFFQKKAKYPKFKKKGRRDSFYVENDRFRIEGKTAILPKIGKVRLREELRFDGKIMSGVVSRTADRWFLSVQVDVGDYLKPRTANGTVGIDLGLTSFATLSTGEKIEAPKPLRKALKKLARLQRVLARRKKGSNRRERTKRALSRLYARISNIRSDFLHKLTTRLCSENQAMGIEDLNVAGMIRNRKLSRAISDVGWGEFRRQIEYKKGIYGTLIEVFDRWFPSTKTCSSCGVIQEGKIPLSIRSWVCPDCGAFHDRDVNAAINLKPLGTGSPEVTLVEMEALAGRNSISETTVYEAGTSLGQICPSS